MKNRNQQLRPISEKNNQESERNLRRENKNDEEGSSDFSDFDLAPKDIGDRDFSPFHKPEHSERGKGKKTKKKNDKKIERLMRRDQISDNKQTKSFSNKNFEKKNENKKSKNQKEMKSTVKNNPKQKNKKLFIEIPKTSEKREIYQVKDQFFKQSSKERDVSEFSHQKQENLQNRRELVDKKQSKEELIVEHDKKQFKKVLKECIQERSNTKPKREYRSVESKYNESQNNMTGSCMLQSKGGLCFDLNVKEFTSPPDKKSRSLKQRKKKRKNTSVVDLNAQILRRRQLAFNYGKMIRMRTFGYL